MKDTIKLKGKTLMIAHRGACGSEQENTLPAFVAACNRSYFGAECDVRATKDGKFVIYHDGDTSRICDKTLKIEESCFSEIRALRLKRFGRENFDETLKIPTLEEYLSVLSRYGKTAVIELKKPLSSKQIREIIGVCKAHYSLDKIIFISFELEYLLTVRESAPAQKVQLLTVIYNQEIRELLIEYRVDADLIFTLITKERVSDLHRHGIAVNCWTCDDATAAQRLVDCGVDFITSNILE